MWQRLLENEFVDRSVALAAKGFVSLFPAIIVVAAFMPPSVRLAILNTMTHRLGLSGEGLSTVKSAFATSDDIRRATGAIGLILTFFYVNSFTNALQRVYTKAWRRPATGRVSAYAVGYVWFIGILAYCALLGGARAIFGEGPQTALFAVLAWLATVTMWWIAPWFLLQRQVRLRVLLPTGIVTGTGLAIFATSASLWMSRNVSENQHQFGFFGVALALVSWLTGASTIVVVGACVGPVLAEDPAWVGAHVRGSPDAEVLAPGAAPALPAPLLAQRLSNALGMHGEDGDERVTRA